MTDDTTGLERRAAKGAALTAAVQGAKLLVQIVSIVALAHLLTPSDFGVVAMVTPIYVFALLFQDVGFSQAVIQRKEISPVQISNLFWLNGAICFANAAAIASLSGLAADFYGEKAVGPLTMAFCGIVAINGLTSLPYALLLRDMRFGAVAKLDLAAYVIGFLASLGCAVAFSSPWAIFASSLASALVMAAGAWGMSGFRPMAPKRGQGTRDLAAFGGGVFLFNLVNFVTKNIDSILLGRVWGDHVLGIYDRANKLLLFPLQQVSMPLSRVLIPTLSRLASEPGRYRATYISAMIMVLLATQPGILFTIVEAQDIVPFVLGSRWTETAGVFQWLGGAALVLPLTYTAGWLFVSQGRSDDLWRFGAATAVAAIACFSVGILWGASGMAAAYAAREALITLPLLVWMVTRKGPLVASDFLGVIAPFAAGCAAAGAAATMTAHLLAGAGLWRPVAVLAVCYLVLPAVVAAFPGCRAVMVRFGRIGAARAAPRLAALRR